jgi:pseudoazurin
MVAILVGFPESGGSGPDNKAAQCDRQPSGDMIGRIIEIEQSAPGLRWHKFAPARPAYQMPSAPETGPTRRRESMMRKLLVIAATAATLVMAGNAVAAEVEVKLLNRGAEGVMVFEPALVKIAPGDSVKFVAADKGHNVESIKGMLPEGATPFVGKNSEDTTVKFDKEGVYGVKCMPHYGMGMVAMIVVGNPVNEDQAKAIPQIGRAKQVFATLFGRLDASKAAAK